MRSVRDAVVGNLSELCHFPLVIVGLLTLCFTGCATSKPTATLPHDSTLVAHVSPDKTYHKVLMLKMDHDPRGVQGKVVAALKSMGFDVEFLSLEEVPAERQGSGFFVGDQGHILTCAHVVGEETNATVWSGGQLLYANVLRVDTNVDAALLKLESQPTNHVEQLFIDPNASLKMGEEVFTIGFPLSDILGKSPRLTKGLVSSTVGLHDDPKSVQVSVEIQAGSSGSPLLNDNGEVVGMIDSTLNAMNVLWRTQGTLPQNVNFAIKPDILSQFLKDGGVSNGVPAGEKSKIAFDQVKDSVVLVRSGHVLPGQEEINELWCRIRYQYLWDLYWRFGTFYLEFFDAKTGKLVLRAGQRNDTLATEGGVIRQALRAAHKWLAPDAPPPATD